MNIHSLHFGLYLETTWRAVPQPIPPSPKVPAKHLTEEEKQHYLKEIKKDIMYFRQTYKRADIEVDISGLDPDEAAVKLKKSLRPIL